LHSSSYALYALIWLALTFLSFCADFTLDQIKSGLEAIGAPQDVIDKSFNVTPPVLMINLNDRSNGTITGFIFNDNDPATAQPIIKSSAVAAGSGALVVTFLLGLLIFV